MQCLERGVGEAGEPVVHREVEEPERDLAAGDGRADPLERQPAALEALDDARGPQGADGEGGSVGPWAGSDDAELDQPVDERWIDAGLDGQLVGGEPGHRAAW